MTDQPALPAPAYGPGPSAAGTPIRLLEVEIGQEIADVPLVHPQTGQRYSRALSLVRLHSRPLGFVELRSPAEVIREREYAGAIWNALGPQIVEHLREDGLPPVAALDAAGLPHAGVPPCEQDRRQFLRDAPFVSVVVATRDRPESIAACLRSLTSLAYPRYEIIVVDNVPTTSATADLIAQAYGAGTARRAGPAVHYVREDHPGPSWARNRGLLLARGELVAFTDDDVLLDPHWLTELVRGFAAGQNVACVTGPIVPRELETPAQIWLEQYGGFCKGFARRLYDLREHRPADRLYPYTVGKFGSGANMAFRTSALRTLGGFDPALGPATPALAAEDIAVFFQVIDGGYQLVYQPGAIVYHAHPKDYARFKKQVYAYGVGFSAFVTKSVIDNPRTLLNLSHKLPRGLAYALSPRSDKNQKKTPGYPRELTVAELRGMLRGPFAYLAGRWRNRVRRPRTVVEARA
ncbi:MAG: glycosyltransferase [Chloroflexota bacterium]